ncbi:sodium:solute symporter family transporter [Clostridium grantii]|uniref:Sodium/pantothenate symporter n=1 Tax=Clostridium grantii DSM 8605 TaxID=1121316 RepID=A0A1M5S887_9CLOT|nr:hypothetical protein [Clostridium grantii]SHH34704.1 sodium/pantothenate symporter [Clostridium grantii DSM 8605]
MNLSSFLILSNQLPSDPTSLVSQYKGMGVTTAIVIVYLLIVLGIGYWATKRTKSSKDFFIAGKQIGPVALALAAFSATLSGWLFVGAPGLIYSIGTGAMWFTMSTAVCYTLLWTILGKRMRLLVEIKDVMTVADAVNERFKSQFASGLAGIATLIGVVLYLATQLLAMGVILSYVFNISVATGVIIGMIVTLLYAIGGGMIAGIYTDVFQGTMMVITSIVIFAIAMSKGGGMLNITNVISTAPALSEGALGLKFVGPFGIVAPIVAMSWFFLLALGIVGQPHLVHKFFMIKDIKRLRHGALLTTVPAIISGLLSFGVGIVVKSKVMSGELAVLVKADDAITVFLLNYTTPVLVGLAFAGIASAIMSTADSFINIAAAAAVRDLPNALGKKLSEKSQLKWGRITSLACGVVSVSLALGLSSGGIALLGAFGYGTFAAALAPTIGMGFNWKRATKEGAISSIAVGLIVGIVLEVAKVLKMGWYMNGLGSLGIYNGLFALSISTIVFIAVSFLTKPAELDKGIEAVMDC